MMQEDFNDIELVGLIEDYEVEEEEYIEVDIKGIKIYIVNVTVDNCLKVNRDQTTVGKMITLPVNEELNNLDHMKRIIEEYPHSVIKGNVGDLVNKTYGLEELIISKFLAVNQ